MSGTVTDTGIVRVYLKRRLSDLWVEHEHLHPAGMVMTTAGAVTDLLLHRSYAPGTPQGARENLFKLWVKVGYTPIEDEATETALWVGTIEDARDMEAEQAVKWIASSLEAQMRRVKLTEGYAEGYPSPALEPCMKVSTLRFNAYKATSSEASEGRRSTNRYHFAAGGEADRLAAYWEGDDTDDIAYAFGSDADWTNQRILEALLSWYAPPGYGGEAETPYSGRPQMCPVGLRLAPTTAAAGYLAGAVEMHDLGGMTLLEAVDRLVERAGPLYWWLDWENWEAGEQSCVLLRVASRLWDDETATASILNVDTADCLDGVVRGRTLDRAERVVARGAPIKVMFTARATAQAGVDLPMLEPYWTGAQEADWLAEGMWVARGERPKPEWDHVFLSFVLPEDAEAPSTGDAYAWRYVQLLPNVAQEGAEIQTVLGAAAIGGYYACAHPILTHNLTWAGYSNPTANSGLPSAPAGADDKPEHDPILAWYIPATPGDDDLVVRIEEITRLKHRAGLRITRKRYRLEDPPFLAEATGVGEYDRWERLIATVSVETDNLLEAVAQFEDYAPNDDQRRTAIVEVPDAEWWAAAEHTVIDVGADGTKSEIYGVLRNDYPRLLDLAQQRLKILDQRVPRNHGQITYKFLQPTVRVGQWVGTYGRYGMRAPILTVAHEIVDIETWGTAITTFQPQTLKDTV